MYKELVLNNLYFAINVFLFLSLFSAFWLHFDSWKLDKKNISYLSRSIAFLFLSISFLLSSARIENELIVYLINITNITGALMFLTSFVTSKVLKNPEEANAYYIAPISLESINKFLPFIMPPILLISLVLLYIKINKGLEKQLKGLFVSFIFLFISAFLKIFYYWSGSNNVFLNNLLSTTGPLTILILILELIAAILLLKWVWGYVRFRAGIQIFISTLTLTLFIFIATTFSFSYLLLRNIEDNILQSLTTDAKVALYSIERLQFEAMANSKAVSSNPLIVLYTENDDSENLFNLTNKYLLDQNLSFVEVTDKNGKLIVSAEDKDLKNVSLSEDPTYKSAAENRPLATIYKKEGAVSPIIEVKASSPVVNKNNEVVGTVISGFLIDNPLLNGIKEVTDMEITVFGNDIRSASTLNTNQREPSYIGVKEPNTKIVNDVLNNNKAWKGQARIANTNYYQVYLPLKSYSETTIGMVSVAKPTSIISSLSQKSIQWTFLTSAFMMLISIIPAYFVAKYIEENTTA